MLPLLRRLPPIVSFRTLGIALLFGLAAGGVLAADLYLRIPGTANTTDAREIFLTIGSALTGPVGGLLIGFMAGAFDPDHALRLYSIIQHVVCGMALGWAYWQILRRVKTTLQLVLAWTGMVFCYYVFAGFLPFVLAFYFFPDLYALYNTGGSMAHTIATAFRGWVTEFILTASITSIALAALPAVYRMPVWRPGSDFLHYIRTQPRLPRRGILSHTLSIRLAVWFGLLSILPLTVFGIFIRDNVTSAFYQQAEQHDRELVEELAWSTGTPGEINLLSPARLHGADNNRVLCIIDSSGRCLRHSDSTKAGSVLPEPLLSQILKGLLASGSGAFVEDPEKTIISYAWTADHAGILVQIRETQEHEQTLLAELERASFIRLSVSVFLTSLVGGLVIWFFLAQPLKRFGTAAMQVGKGNFNVRLRTADLDDDIAEMAARFNLMIENLKQLRFGLETEISDRKAAEVLLLESERRFRELADLLPQTVYEADASGFITFGNRHGLEEFQYSREDMRRGMNVLALIAPEDRERARESLQAIMMGAVTRGMEYMAIRRNGSRFPVLVYSAPIQTDGAIVGFRGFVVDITDRKIWEAALVENEAKYRTVIEQSADGIVLVDTDGTVIECNRAQAQIMGLSREQIVGCKAWDVFLAMYPPEERTAERHDRFQEKALKALTGDSPLFTQSIETAYKRPDGTPGVLHQTVFPIKTEKGIRLGAIMRDVTERLRNQEALKRSEEKFSRAFHVSPDSININRMHDGMYIEVNEGFTTLTGYTVEDVAGKTSEDINIWNNPEDRRRLVKTLLETGEMSNLEAVFRMKNGARKIGAMSAKVIHLNGERCILSITRDITERKRAEEALKESEERFRSVFEHAAIGIFSSSPSARFMHVNKAMCDITGYSADELLHMSFRDITVEEDLSASEEKVRRTLAGEISGFTVEKRYRHKKGGILWVNVTISLLRDASGEPKYFIGVMENITERRNAQLAIEASLREKEVLLKEVHHRVKNNLQVVSSLLSLQAGSIRDDEDRSLFRESQDRIRTMALIHERLYRSSDFAHVDFSRYVDSLVTSLFNTYRSPSVSYSMAVAEVGLPVDTAIPCGLIINELVTNALKHAFPDGRTGHIEINFGNADGGLLQLEVRDDGVGPPADLNMQAPDKLGLQLITILAEQLRGKFSVERNGGTVFKVTFPA